MDIVGKVVSGVKETWALILALVGIFVYYLQYVPNDIYFLKVLSFIALILACVSIWTAYF